MRHWWHIGTRNWSAKPGRTAAGIIAIALGVGVVVWVNGAYESVRQALRDQVWFWIGGHHLSIESTYGPIGVIDASIATRIRENDNLKNIDKITMRLRHTMSLQAVIGTGSGAQGMVVSKTVDAVGIEPETEYDFRDHSQKLVAGRLLTPDDRDALVLESSLAEQLELDLGDDVTLRRPSNTAGAPAQVTGDAHRCTIDGLIQHRRVAKQQNPMILIPLQRLQMLVGQREGKEQVTRIEVRLTDSSHTAISRARSQLQGVTRRDLGTVVNTTSLRLAQVDAAEKQSGFILLLISTVALFTGLFVILSTLSMSVVERIGELGTLRCLGMTRFQLATTVLAEAVPIAAVGMALGLPIGFALGAATVFMAPEYVGELLISKTGVVLALGGGALTTLLGAIVPMLHAMRVSPLSASRPEAKPSPSWIVWVAGAVGTAMLVAHWTMLKQLPIDKWFRQPMYPVISVILLYCGYALITPALVRIIGRLAVRVVAVIMRVRHGLLRDQIGRATWRSSAIACGLMVGLSLIVSIVVHSNSIASGWNFPKRFCEAFVYVLPPVPYEQADAARRKPGVAGSCMVNSSPQVMIRGKGLLSYPFARYLAVDLEEFFQIAELEFIEGTQADAIAKVNAGGHVLVTPEFVRSHKYDYDEDVIVQSGLFGRRAKFRIAGVVTSPALDIAANYFNAGGMLASQSMHVVIGSHEDLKRSFLVDHEADMILLNFGLEATEPPEVFLDESPFDVSDARELAARVVSWRALLPECATDIAAIEEEVEQLPDDARYSLRGAHPALQRVERALHEMTFPRWRESTPAQRWQAFREEMVLRGIAGDLPHSFANHMSVRALKDQIDGDLRRATVMISAIPMVALIVAALGVGNLMMAKVASSARQLAILRAIGATKSQVVRLILSEALVLGALGSAVGVGLGLHAAAGIRYLVEAIWGFRTAAEIPYGWVAISVSFTIVVCLLAGVAPALHAARTNIIKSLQTT